MEMYIESENTLILVKDENKFNGENAHFNDEVYIWFNKGYMFHAQVLFTDFLITWDKGKTILTLDAL